ncbi:MAG: hypothetical protein ACLT76_03115 [Clostridium fessum]
MDFEYLKMPVRRLEHDAYLTNRYGDYMTPQIRIEYAWRGI